MCVCACVCVCVLLSIDVSCAIFFHNIEVVTRFYQDFCSKNSAGSLRVELLQGGSRIAVVICVTPCCHCRFVGTCRVVECASASPVPTCFYCFPIAMIARNAANWRRLAGSRAHICRLEVERAGERGGG